MTVASQVKGCFSSLKSTEATVMALIQKTQDENMKRILEDAQQIISEVKNDLEKQLLHLTRQEPQYKQ